MLRVAPRQHYGDKDNQDLEPAAAAAAARVAELWRCGENALVLPVLTLLQAVAETAHHGELLRQRVLRFVLPLSFVYFDYFMFQFGDEAAETIPTPRLLDTVLLIADTLLAQKHRDAATHLCHLGGPVFLFNLLLQFDLAPAPVLARVCSVLVRLALAGEDAMFSVLQFTHTDVLPLLLLAEGPEDAPGGWLEQHQSASSERQTGLLLDALTAEEHVGERCGRVWDLEHRQRLFAVVHDASEALGAAVADWTPSAGRAFDVRLLDCVWPALDAAVTRWAALELQKAIAPPQPEVEEAEEDAEGEGDAAAEADADADVEAGADADVEAPADPEAEAAGKPAPSADAADAAAATTAATTAPVVVVQEQPAAATPPPVPAPARAAPPPPGPSPSPSPPPRPASPSDSAKPTSSRFASLASRFEASAPAPPPPGRSPPPPPPRASQ
jgi:hypothetical protein